MSRDFAIFMAKHLAGYYLFTVTLCILYTTTIANVKKLELPISKIFGNKAGIFRQIEKSPCKHRINLYNKG